MLITKDDIGRKLWDRINNEWVSIDAVNESSVYNVFLSNGNCCTKNGLSIKSYKTPRYVWQEIPFVEPEKPKKKVKKTVVIWVDVYPDNKYFENQCFKFEDRADDNHGSERITCVKCVGEYEVEE